MAAKMEDNLGLEEDLRYSLDELNSPTPLTPTAVLAVEIISLEKADVPCLRGPDSGYDFPPPTGSYGETQSIADVNVTDHRTGGGNRKLSNGAFPDLSNLLLPSTSSRQTPPGRVVPQHLIIYSTEQLLALRHSAIIQGLWEDTYESQLAAEFACICRHRYNIETSEDNEDLAASPSNMELRPYQTLAAEKSLRGENDIILLPTGTGKTLVAIRVIVEHIERSTNGAKVVFFVPSIDLASQQLKAIKQHVPAELAHKCTKITGSENMSAEMVRDVIKGDKHLVLVVTPAIIENYFLTSELASISDFSLLVFDEVHHTRRKHPYSILIGRYGDALAEGQNSPIVLPQLLGLTATIGIGDAKTLHSATDYILQMCARFNLSSAPWQEELKLLAGYQTVPTEETVVLSSQANRLTVCIQSQLMEVLENAVRDKVDGMGEKLEIVFLCESSVDKFPTDRMAQIYEHDVISLRTMIIEMPDNELTRADARYCKVALNYLRVFYECLQLINLLSCFYGLKYLKLKTNEPSYQGVAHIWELFEGNLSALHTIEEFEDRKSPNKKIAVLRDRLEALFEEKPNSKVIIFVQLQVVARYLAEMLVQLNPAFRANPFTAIGTGTDAGMTPQQRYDVRAKFEGAKYNILVATSVLEEGIDIQACNMVVRYMYVKDMIAKIQSRGRAREREGILLTIIDEKLREQEERNDAKEELMLKALQQVQDMSQEDFREKVGRKLTEFRQVVKPNPQIPTLRESYDNVEICCVTCSSVLGRLADVRTFNRTLHLAIDSSVREKVTVEPFYQSFYDGICNVGRLRCNYRSEEEKPCGQHVGVLTKTGSGYIFAMWRAKGGIALKVNSEMEKVDRWNDITTVYRLKPIYMEQLHALGPTMQFRQPREGYVLGLKE